MINLFLILIIILNKIDRKLGNSYSIMNLENNYSYYNNLAKVKINKKLYFIFKFTNNEITKELNELKENYKKLFLNYKIKRDEFINF